MGDTKITTQATADWHTSQSWDWEEFLFAGKLHRCGYAADRVMVLVVALALGQETKPAAAH